MDGICQYIKNEIDIITMYFGQYTMEFGTNTIEIGNRNKLALASYPSSHRLVNLFVELLPWLSFATQYTELLHNRSNELRLLAVNNS